MRSRSKPAFLLPNIQAKHQNGVAKARKQRRGTPSGKRARGGQRDECVPFAPPEDWHEATTLVDSDHYDVKVQPPGEGFRHIVSERDVRERLSLLPERFLKPLAVVQLSRMTRKKQSFPCYGMQWGPALYLYPLEVGLVEHFYQPPRPELVNETRMYGGKWEQDDPGVWRLVWSEESIRDFYLNNVLIHELGHLLDDRNASYVDRERYAEWFALQFGFRPTRHARRGRLGKRPVVRRHHA